MTSETSGPIKAKVVPRGAPELDITGNLTSGVYTMWNRPLTGRVLLVEPDPDIARMLEVRLAREGHEVIVCETGEAAITAAGEETIDVVLVDRKLADRPGLEVMKQLREDQKPLEAIVTSVDPTNELLLEALEAGALDVVVKPFSNLKIVTIKIKNAVGKVRAERDRDDLARLIHAQTRDIVNREHEAEQRKKEEEPVEDDEDMAFDLGGMSGVDPLTGLPNRRAAEDRFRKETSRALRYDRPLCIALASVDELEAVIEKFGGDVADGVLRGIASMFEGMVRDVDFVARRQGGEFLFIFPETPKDRGFIVVDRIRKKMNEISFSDFIEEGTGEFRLSASFGIAGLPTDTMNADILRDAAEAALAHAKASGDRVILFDGSMVRRI